VTEDHRASDECYFWFVTVNVTRENDPWHHLSVQVCVGEYISLLVDKWNLLHQLFQNIVLCRLVNIFGCFGGVWCPHIQGQAVRAENVVLYYNELMDLFSFIQF
jgi:hypothetical protein